MLRTVKVVQEPPQGHWGWKGQHWPVWGKKHGKREHLQSGTWQQCGGFGIVPQTFGSCLTRDPAMLCEPSAPCQQCPCCHSSAAAARSPAGTPWMSPGRIEPVAGLGFGTAWPSGTAVVCSTTEHPGLPNRARRRLPSLLCPLLAVIR